MCNGSVLGSLQLLALVQWRAWAHACVTTAMPSSDRAEAAGSHWVTLSAQPWLLTAMVRTPDWLTVTRNLTCCSGLVQHPPQQVHAVDQVRCSSGGHQSPVHWLLWGRRRRSLWPVAPPTSTSSPRRCHDIQEIGDIIGLCYQNILISEALITPYHRKTLWLVALISDKLDIIAIFHDLCYVIMSKIIARKLSFCDTVAVLPALPRVEAESSEALVIISYLISCTISYHMYIWYWSLISSDIYYDIEYDVIDQYLMILGSF